MMTVCGYSKSLILVLIESALIRPVFE